MAFFLFFFICKGGGLAWRKGSALHPGARMGVGYFLWGGGWIFGCFFTAPTPRGAVVGPNEGLVGDPVGMRLGGGGHIVSRNYDQECLGVCSPPAGFWGGAIRVPHTLGITPDCLIVGGGGV